MHLALRTLLCLFCALSPVSLCAQPLQSEANDPNSPPYANVRPQDTEQLRAGVREMHQLLRELQQSDLNPAQKQAALDQLIRDHHDILRMHNTWLDWQQPQTVDSASLLLEKMIFEVAAEDIAPDAQSREQVLHDAPQHLELDPEQQAAEHYEPPLLTPVSPVKPAGDGEQSHAQEATQETVPSAMSAAEPAPPPTDKPGDDKPRELAIDKNTKVAVLADDKSTAHMHEDSTVLRQVTDDKGDLLLFGDIRLWIGGAIQLDAYSGDGLYTLDQDGDSDSKSYIRRGEGILRASVLQNAEIKVQYDFDTREFRSLYWRWLSQSTSRSLTLGNQKEPIGQDYLVGSKFTTAMEPSAPSSAFGSYRSTGIRYNGWHALESSDNPFHLWGDSRTHVTTSVGLFGKDIENTNDTDWAVSGRVTIGGRKTEQTGYHLGASASYRHGEYERIAPRPGLQDVNRITLASPDADTQALVVLEGLANMGSLHGQWELFYSDYSGGTVDAEGWGGYGQVGWLFGDKQRVYHPRWGLWGAIDAAHKHVFEVFGRFSYTRGDDDISPANELALLTLGGNWYYRQLRISSNLLFSDTQRDISGENDGLAFALRLQYLF